MSFERLPGYADAVPARSANMILQIADNSGADPSSIGQRALPTAWECGIKKQHDLRR